MTNLVVYSTTNASTILSTAALLDHAVSGAGNHVSINLGKGSGFSELYGLGTTQTWQGLSDMTTPTGNGFNFDNTLLNGHGMSSGTWDDTLTLWLSQNASVGGDLYLRAFRYDVDSNYLNIVTAKVAGITLTSTHSSFSLSASGISMDFSSGEYLYLDAWFNCTSPSSLNDVNILLGVGSATGGVTGHVQAKTPGYI